MADLASQVVPTKTGLLMTLRSAKHEDATELLNVMRTNLGTSDHLVIQLDEFDLTVEQQEKRIQSFAEKTGDLWMVALVENKIVGLLDFSSGTRRRNSHQGTFAITILPEFRGQGVGHIMISALLNWAAHHPTLEQVRLKVQSRNSPAMSLYKKLGFIEEGCEVKGVKLSSIAYDDVIAMVKHV